MTARLWPAGTRAARPATTRPAPPSPAGPTIASVRIDARCTACGACLITCPHHALLAAPGRPLVVDQRCTACSACIEICPSGAITEVGSPLL